MMMDPLASNNAQHGDWSALMASMALEHGGRAERLDEDNEPIWGWARQVPGAVLAGSIDDAEDIDFRPQPDPMKEYRSQCINACHGSGEFPSLPGTNPNLFQFNDPEQGQFPSSPFREFYGDRDQPQGQPLSESEIERIMDFINRDP